MSTKSAALKTQRKCKHGTPPGSGWVRITEQSGLRKLMRAARRGRVPEERIGVCVAAMESAAERPGAWLHRVARERAIAEQATVGGVLS